MSTNIHQLKREINQLNKKIDVELLLSTGIQAEILNLNHFSGRTFEECDDIILEISRAIVKDRYGSTDTVVRINKNQEGMSISVKNEAISRCLNFVNRSVDRGLFEDDNLFNGNAYREFHNSLSLRDLAFFSLHSNSLQQKENRLVFYIQFTNPNRYSSQNFLVFNALFEMIHAIEFLETAAEQIDHFSAELDAHQARLDIILIQRREREEREEAERQAVLEEERRQREERQRIENERLAELRRIEAERLAEARRIREAEIAAENARQQAEYERRQQLLQNGATEGGIDIANQLLSFLGR